MTVQTTQLTSSDFILEEGSYTNEDKLTILENTAWVIDGTSGFSERSITDHPESDGVWFVETVDQYLRENVNDEIPLEDLIANTIEHTVSKLESAVSTHLGQDVHSLSPDDAVSMHEMPGATIGLVRWNAETLEYYSLADSSVMVRTPDNLDHYNEGGPQKFDAVLQDKVEAYLADHPDAGMDEVRQNLLPHIRESRQYREVPGGFWCLGINPLSATHAVQGQYPIESVEDIYLFTDGLLNVVDLFGLFEDWEAVADEIDAKGVDQVLEQLRTVQEDDISMIANPRLKPMDDVAIIHLEFDS